MKAVERAKRALWAASGFRPGEYDRYGYLPDPSLNLLKGIDQDLVKAEYLRGSGLEWVRKFRAIHSSAALAANAFGRWKTEPQKLKFLGFAGFDPPCLEKHCATGLGGIPPNLDVFLQCKDAVIGIESKLLEPLATKKPGFSDSYSLENLSFCEDSWLNLLQEVKEWSKSRLDAAQLIKHYIGLRNQFQSHKKVILVYLFWKPLNAEEFRQYFQHADELAKFKSAVRASVVEFVAMDYPTLWDSWAAEPDMKEHAESLRARYCVTI